MKIRRLPLHDRVPFVLDLVAGSWVVSVGLGGQTGETTYSFDVTSEADLSGTFSVQLARVAAETVFLDVSSEAIAAFASQVDATYHLADIQEPHSWTPEVASTRCQHVVLGEVLEHLDRPGAALRSMRSLLEPGGDLIVTVPNAFNLSVIARMVVRDENVHPEHVAYYSPSTLTRLLSQSGYRVIELGFYRTRPLRLRQMIDAPLGFVSGLVAEGLPQFGRGLVAVAQPIP